MKKIVSLCTFTVAYAIVLVGAYAQQPDLTELEAGFLQLQSSERFKNHLQNLTKAPHITGTKANEEVRDYMVKVMRDAGMEVEIFPYDIYLPVMPGIAEAEIVEPVRLPLNNQEYIHKESPFSAHPDLVHGFNAYTGSGEATAEIVYANYGRKEDFEQLEAMGISVKGKIVLARYGGNFRGYKAKYAEQYGAVGLIIYTDPSDNGYMRGLVFPEGPFFDESTIQRGSVLTLDYSGDPLTPFEAALPTDSKTKVNRLKPEEVKGLHSIPVLPLPYGSAKEIISRMSGNPVPGGWQGGLPYTYRLEGGPDLKVKVKVQQDLAIQRVYNVVGTFKGTEFPDEWIIAGCHYDAWAFGATDPNSGTAMLLALSESLGMMAKEGNLPRRTIKIAHWDAEEVGIIGSTEWVEQFKNELQEKGVAYLNADGAVSGKSFGGAASPTMKDLLLEATQKVNYPDSQMSVYDHWKGSKETPAIGNLGGGSDHLGFYAHIGIPAWSAGTGGPTPYHSNFDDFYFYEKFIDPSFKMGPMVEQVFGIAMLSLANSDVLPYSLARYGEDLEQHLKGLEALVAAYDKTATPFSFEPLLAAAKELKTTTNSCQVALSKAPKGKLKAVNKALLMLERAWIDQEGMPYGSWFRSLYASSDPYSGYASWMLPGFQHEASLKSTTNLKKWEGKYLKAIEQLQNQLEAVLKMLE